MDKFTSHHSPDVIIKRGLEMGFWSQRQFLSPSTPLDWFHQTPLCRTGGQDPLCSFRCPLEVLSGYKDAKSVKLVRAGVQNICVKGEFLWLRISWKIEFSQKLLRINQVINHLHCGCINKHQFPATYIPAMPRWVDFSWPRVGVFFKMFLCLFPSTRISGWIWM